MIKGLFEFDVRVYGCLSLYNILDEKMQFVDAVWCSQPKDFGEAEESIGGKGYGGVAEACCEDRQGQG